MENLLPVCGPKETAFALKLPTDILEQAEFAQDGVALRKAIFVRLLKGLKIAQGRSRPELLDANDVKEDEPTAALPNLLSKVSKKVRFTYTSGTNNNLAHLSVGLTPSVPVKNCVRESAEYWTIECLDILAVAGPDAPNRPDPVEVYGFDRGQLRVHG
jgi:hypothetical protein